jgi:Right handed beta helix region
MELKSQVTGKGYSCVPLSVFFLIILIIATGANGIPATPSTQVLTQINHVFNVKEYGARGDCRYADDANMNAGSTVLTSAAASFGSADVGKPIYLLGAGIVVNGNADPLSTTISSVRSGSAADLADAAQTTVSSAHMSWGTDNTVSIQKAIEAAAAASGGTIFFPVGTYQITKVLTITAPNIRLTGEGNSSVIYMSNIYSSVTGGKRNQGDGLPEVFVGRLAGEPISNIEIDHLKFTNSGTQIHNAVNGSGLITVIDGSIVNNVKFHDLTLETASRVGITQAANSDTFEIYNNSIVGGLHGFYIAGQGSNGFIHDNHLVNIPALAKQYNSAGFAIKNQTNCRVVSNIVDSYRWAILISDHPEQHVVIDHNTILHSEIGIATNWGSDLVFSNNLIDTATQTGIWVRAVGPVDHLKIADNDIRNVGHDGVGYGIQVLKTGTGSVSNVDIEDNRLTDCSGGIQFFSVVGLNVIRGNMVDRGALAKIGLGFYLGDLPPGNTRFINNVTTGFPKSELPPTIVQTNNHLN